MFVCIQSSSVLIWEKLFESEQKEMKKWIQVHTSANAHDVYLFPFWSIVYVWNLFASAPLWSRYQLQNKKEKTQKNPNKNDREEKQNDGMSLSGWNAHAEN